MAKTASRRLVIDACVAGQAGDRIRLRPEGKACREFLDAVLRVCHRIVTSEDIFSEWKEHAGSFAWKWLRCMAAAKKWERIAPQSMERLEQGVARTHATDAEREIMKKDLRLIDAALASDRCVVSLDKVRTLFALTSATTAELRSVVWVNPDLPEDHPIEWLEQGAPAEEHRKLGGDA